MAEPIYIYSRLIPLKGFRCLTVWPWVFVRSEYKGRLTPADNAHEKIHLAQQEELLVVPFLILYVTEWLVKVPVCFLAGKNAYRSISFEQEACRNEKQQGYLPARKHYAWTKYIFKTVKK